MKFITIFVNKNKINLFLDLLVQSIRIPKQSLLSMQ